ncbi:McrB family protein [Thermococcus camini]|uniref:AAA+ ATPase domain-containing protein n=1 Tax=Thermococcus camini TaxID=2016373 RepID=A0A7G2D8G7_9EURY|nr:AAA family ATPase [Thermococcus camini]CAD5244909.1 conserved protein of unknown function [Thermococcus camini]
MREDILEAVLKKGLEKYHEEWRKNQEAVFENIGKLRDMAKKDYVTAEDVRSVHDNVTKRLKNLTGIEILWLWGGKDAKIEEFLNRQEFKTLLSKAERIKDVSEAEELQELLMKVTQGKHTKLSTVSSWLCVMNSKVFYPMHTQTLPKQLREKIGIEIIWGGKTNEKSIQEYLAFLKTLERINKKLGIENMVEAAFYLSRFSKGKLESHETNQPNYYLEITKPPGKPYLENHVGRFLWSPADERYLDGREGKIGLLNTGDIIVHDVNGKIVGYSKVAEKPKVVSRDEIIKIFTDEGIWNPEYSKFAEGWFRKSPDDKFYLVKLRDFQKLPEKIGYTKLKHLPHPTSIQGVYLKEIDSKVLEELGVVSSKNKDIPSQGLTLRDYLASKGYLYQEHLVSQFYTALKTKGFVILSGLTGTGKTKIVQELAKLLDSSGENFLFLSVRPDWRDSKALLGYYNPLTGKYHRTKLLDFILKARKDYERNGRNSAPYFLLLDEMNLAHVEYYFADFLSVLESGRDEDGFTREGIKLHDVDEVETFDGIPKELHLPPNLYIIGTVNMDETTYSFSPKVLDRAFTVEFHDVELEVYPSGSGESRLPNEAVDTLRDSILRDLSGKNGQFLARSKGEINEAVKELKDAKSGEYWRILIELNKALEPYDMHFGYRVVDDIALFVQRARESWENGIVEFESDDEIFDLALLMKVLPKFHGNRKKLEEPLKAVLGLCLLENAGLDVRELRRGNVLELLRNWETQRENFRFRHTAKKVLRMLRQLYEIGFASFS